MKNSQVTRIAVMLLFGCGTIAAQPKPGTGSTQQSNSQQSNSQQSNGNQSQNIPPEIYRLEDLPTSRAAATAELNKSARKQAAYPKNSWQRVWRRRPVPGARFVWYITKKSNSTALPVEFVKLTCADIFDSKGNLLSDFSADKDPDLVDACSKRKSHNESLDVSPSYPEQNRNPLRLGDSLIIAIYDKEYLLTQSQISWIGMTLQAQAGSAVNTDPLRPTISSSGGGNTGSPGSSPTGGGASPAAIENVCSNLTATNGTLQRQKIGLEFAATLRVTALGPDQKPKEGIAITFQAPEGDRPTGTFEEINGPNSQTVSTDKNGQFSVPFFAGTKTGTYTVSAQCTAEGGLPNLVGFQLTNLPQRPFYYIPWINNPLPGDSTISVTITAQAPSPVPVVLVTNPPRLAVIVNNETVTTPISRTYPAGTLLDVNVNSQGRYDFLRWSDGGDQHHFVSVGTSATTLTAEFVSHGSTVPVTILTSPPGVPITVTGCAVDSGVVWRCQPKQNLTVQAPARQSIGGHTYYFASWSDGGGRSHMVPVVATTILVANFSEGPVPPTGGVTVNLVATPAGAQHAAFRIDGIGYTAPQALSFPGNTQFDLDIPMTQNIDGTLYSYSCPASGTVHDGLCHSSPTLGAVASNVSADFQAVTPAPPAPNALTIVTDPPGMIVTIQEKDRQPVYYVATHEVATPVTSGTEITIGVPQQHQYDGRTYTFDNWSSSKSDPPNFAPLVKTQLNAGTDATKLKATFDATPSATPVVVSTNPAGLAFSVNGVATPQGASARVGYFQPGSIINLETSSPQTFGGIQYSFQGWSDASSTSLTHPYTLPGTSQQTTAPSSASLTAVFAPSSAASQEQSSPLLNGSYPQSHNLYRFNITTGLIVSNLKNPTWTRQETATGVTCPSGAPQPCIPSPSLYQTLPNPIGPTTIDPVLFFTIYWPYAFDGGSSWHKSNLIPAPSLGFSLTSPTNDYFVGVSSEIVRGVQVVFGTHVGKINQLVPPAVNDPTSSTAPQITQHFHLKGFVGLTFNVSFITNLFGGKPPSGN